MASTCMSLPTEPITTSSIILFYKYQKLCGDEDSTCTELYREALESLCNSLKLRGRILVSASEGINGTLAGNSKSHVEAFTYALLGPSQSQSKSQHAINNSIFHPILQAFWQKCSTFSQITQIPVLTMSSQDDFKWSSSTKSPSKLFPDLNIKLVTELIGTGGLLSETISIEETARGYLTPMEWDTALRGRNPQDSLLIDCRNIKECQIGHFHQAINPGTTTFSQFPQWIRDNQPLLHNKQVFMYCTGGIRCEKASAYIRKVVPQVKEVHHLKGGIHKYLEVFPNQDMSLWRGKNFVFDGRTSQQTTICTDQDVQHDNDHITIVGQCIYCKTPYDTYLPENVCTVCREPTLVCSDCQRPEIHCQAHFHLRNCYFHNLNTFSRDDLLNQLYELEKYLTTMAIGKKFKQKRKTLQKQWDKIQVRINSIDKDNSTESSLLQKPKNASLECRNCGDVDCTGSCWGFYSLKRKNRLENDNDDKSKQQRFVVQEGDKKTLRRQERCSSNQRASKESRRQKLLDHEIAILGLRAPASSNRDSVTGLRIPVPCVRVLETNAKGKWCGKTILDVVREEFVNVHKDLDNVLEHGLLRVNHKTVTRNDNFVLKNMDVIERLVHWHEPPVVVPSLITVQHIRLPQEVILEYKLDNDSTLFVCDKPTTVPVHPTGPYWANTLTVMVEAQEGFNTTLNPCHRLDRATSGLTICSLDVKVSRLVQGTIMEEGGVKKLYVAKVYGKFPASTCDVDAETYSFGVLSFPDDIGTVQVSAPIEVVDPSSGMREVGSNGKVCISRFRLIHYNEREGTSTIVCHPITGRGHQLRVHLKSLGYPIVGDILYGGRKDGDSCDIPIKCVLSRIQASLDNPSDGRDEKDDPFSTTCTSDVTSVESSCRICCGGQEGIRTSFNDSQLLQGGHSIFLHALRYEIIFRKRGNPLKHIVGTLTMEVDLPRWAVTNLDLDARKRIAWF